MIDLRFNLISICLCPACQHNCVATESAVCPACGDALPPEVIAEAQSLVRRRRQTFKVRLRRLDERMHAVTDRPLVFATRGVPRSKRDHLHHVIRPALEGLRDRSQSVMQLLETGTWDPAAAGCIEAFGELVRTLDTGLGAVEELRAIMPALEWRAVHRELTRAIAQCARGQVLWALMIGAPDTATTLRLQAAGTAALQASERHVAQVGTLMKRIEQSPKDGPFAMDGSIDIAALAWSAVGQRSTSIEGASELVREALADLPDVPGLSDEHAVLLLPWLVAGAGVVDPGTLTRCVLLMRALLDANGPPHRWLIEPGLLVERLSRGLDRAASHIERLGREWRYGLPRIHVMETLTDVYSNLVEGPLRDLGAVVLIAARASRGDDNGTYEAPVVNGIKAGEVVDELRRLCFPNDDALNMTFRNASAHADIEITDTGIEATARRIEHGREVSPTKMCLSDDEFAEYMVVLQEVIVALQLALLPWLWTSEDQAIKAAFAAASVSQRQVHQTIALIGGTAGLREITVAASDRQVEISASVHEDVGDRRETMVLSLVPAAFGLSPQATTVTLALSGLRPVAFIRGEFMESVPDEAPHRLALLGLVTAKWLLESGSSWTRRDEATYITFPLTLAYFSCTHLVGREPQRTDTIDQAVASLQAVVSRLDAIFTRDRRSGLTKSVVRQLRSFVDSLTGLAEFQRGRRSAEDANRLAQRAAAAVPVMYELQQRALAIRDSGAAHPNTNIREGAD